MIFERQGWMKSERIKSLTEDRNRFKERNE